MTVMRQTIRPRRNSRYQFSRRTQPLKLSAILCVAVLLSHVPAPAQDPDGTAPPQPADTSETPLPTDPNAGVNRQATTQSALTGTGTAEAANTGSTTGGQPIGNPFNFQTDLFTGRFSYSIPIVVAPGRQGAQPLLALAYNSSGGNGWCGVGWNLDVGFIQRDTRRGPPIKWGATNALSEYDDTKCFVANFGGVNACLVLVGPANNNPSDFRAEVDTTFQRYRYYWNSTDPYWQVIDKGGNSFFFGRTSASRMENTRSGWNPPNSGKAVFRWALDRVIDVNGNETTLAYSKTSGMLYLSNISYNGHTNGPISATHTVDFALIGRSDKTISFQPGYRVETTQLLSNITVKVSGNLVRRYQLNYTNSASTFRSLVSSVTTFGSDNTSSLPPQTFFYQVKPFSFEASRGWPGVYAEANDYSTDGWYSSEGVDGYQDTFAVTIDVDGDGLPDRVMRQLSSPYTYWAVQRNTGSSFYPANGIYQWGPLDSQGYSTDTQWNAVSGSHQDETSSDLVDLNGDGFPDRIMRHRDSPYTNFVVQFNLGIPGWGGLSVSNNWGPVTNESSIQEWRSLRYGTIVKKDLLDINGDGLLDRVMRRVTANGLRRNYGQRRISDSFRGQIGTVLDSTRRNNNAASGKYEPANASPRVKVFGIYECTQCILIRCEDECRHCNKQSKEKGA